MESEEYEQIPWANLVAEAQPSVDRRLYVVGAVAAAVVAVFLLARMTAPSIAAPAQPADIGVTSVVPVAADPVVSDTITEPDRVTEADLMADVGSYADQPDPAVQLIAEWFVTDYFTRDGSEATVESLRRLMSADALANLPHHAYDGSPETVEWATMFDVDTTPSGFDVSVAYRTIHTADGASVRDPVRAVVVRLAVSEFGWTVLGQPTATDLPGT